MLRIMLLVHILCYFALYCQCTSNHGKFRMLNGTAASLEDFPYFVGIGYILGNQWIISCSGTIINRRSVLTAASCHLVEPIKRRGDGESKDIYIRTNTNIFNENEIFGANFRKIVKFENHPDFRSHYFLGRYGFFDLNDLAVLTVAEEQAFEFEPFYPRIIGPELIMLLHTEADHQQLASVAYGIDQFSKKMTSKELLATPISYNCTNVFGYLPAKDILCVNRIRNLDSLPCGLDRGGPLIWRDVLIGVGFMYHECDSVLHDLPKFTEFVDLQKSYEFIKKHAHSNVTFVDELPLLNE